MSTLHKTKSQTLKYCDHLTCIICIAMLMGSAKATTVVIHHFPCCSCRGHCLYLLQPLFRLKLMVIDVNARIGALVVLVAVTIWKWIWMSKVTYYFHGKCLSWNWCCRRNSSSRCFHLSLSPSAVPLWLKNSSDVVVIPSSSSSLLFSINKWPFPFLAEGEPAKTDPSFHAKRMSLPRLFARRSFWLETLISWKQFNQVPS